MQDIIDQLSKEHILPASDFKRLLQNLNEAPSGHFGCPKTMDNKDESSSGYLYESARKTAFDYFQNKIYIRGLIECTNYCKNDCYYCGIRRSNKKVKRYRLTKEDILACCNEGYEIGFRTFVLQGGEDPAYTDEMIIDVVRRIKDSWPDCAVTLSFGEKSYQTYEAFYKAGADRYLLRHETADAKHYKKLHPEELSSKHRKECLCNLKKIGFQTGSGIMVGSPYQTVDHIIEDLLFLYELKPQMIGIGPYLSHKDTPFANEQNGRLDQTLHLIAILRLMFPNALIPATTALGTIDKEGRELGILAGANVVMPNLSPLQFRKEYTLYDNKICTGDEAAEYLKSLSKRMDKIGYRLVVERGDYVPVQESY